MTRTITTDRFVLQFSPAKLPSLAKSYRYPKEEAALAAGSAIRNGEFTRENLSRIFEWKTKGRGRTRLDNNTDDEISDALTLACKAKTERAALAVLCGLHGVNVPVASAILTAIDPKRYTIIDFRALEGLGNKSKYRSIGFYLAYLEACRRIAKAHNITLRNLDRALWQWSKD